MPNKLIDLLQHSYAVIVNDDNEHYQRLKVKDEDMLEEEEEYEPVMVNEQDDGNFDDYETSDVVQEIYDADINIDQSNNAWRYSSIRYLIYCWSQLREQFLKCPDSKKNTMLWQNVSEHMFERGFYFDAQACESKWHGLKKVYMYNKTRTSKKDGTKHIIVWAHYGDMDKAIRGIPYGLSGFADVDEVDDDLQEPVSPMRDNSTSVRDDVDKLSWTTEASKELIRLYGKERKRFSAVNQGSKHLLWEEIAQQLSELGHHYSSNSCNDKWRNLKMSYKKNKQRAMKYGEQNVKWFYFKDIDNILQNASQDSASQQRNNIITISLHDTNELVEVKKEKNDYDDDDSDFQTSSITVMENDDQNDSTESNDNIDGDEIITPLGSSSEVWTEDSTKCLIELWGLYRPRFLMAPQGKKRLLWDEISEQLRERGYNYPGVVCDRKWRLLKANYFKRKEKYKKLGMGGVKWQYYYDLDRLLGVPVETISWSMDSTMCLIDCFHHHKDKFMNAATGEKLSIWKEISEEMLQNGFVYSPRACDNKWRTLKNRYNKNRMRVNRNKKVIWVYYDKIDSVLRDDKTLKAETQNVDASNQMHETNESGEHNYIRTLKPDSSYKPTEIVAELKEMFRLRNAEFDQWLKKMDEDLKIREKVFEDLQHQVLDALNRSNELEALKLKLLEKLVSRLPQTL